MIIFLGSTALLLCVILAVLTYFTSAPFAVKLITFPLVILLGVAQLIYLGILAGAPINGFPKGEWEYAAHKLENKGETIVLWAWVEKYEDYRHYRMPYTRNTAKKLNEAKLKSKLGQKVKGKFNKKKGENELILSKGTLRKTHNPLKEYEEMNEIKERENR